MQRNQNFVESIERSFTTVCIDLEDALNGYSSFTENKARRVLLYWARLTRS